MLDAIKMININKYYLLSIECIISKFEATENPNLFIHKYENFDKTEQFVA